MIQRTVLTITLATALCLGIAGSAKADIIATVGEYNGAPDFDFNPSDYLPATQIPIGDFDFTVPNGLTVIGGTVSGTFGNTDVYPSSAPSDLYIDNGTIEVAECDDADTLEATCSSSATQTPTAWSYTFSSNDLTALSSEIAAGDIDFFVVQTDGVAVQTGTTTLDLVLSPEPSTIYIFCGGLAGIILLRRFRKA
jgi:hypothetical protein